MPVCKFFLQGNCRFGRSCRNEHPTGSGGSGYGGGGGFSSGGGPRNRFEGGNQGGFGRQDFSNGQRSKSEANTRAAPPSGETVKFDLLESASGIWPLTSYGLGEIHLIREADFSFEEMRWEFYDEFKRTGSVNNAMANWQGRLAAVEKRKQEILRDPEAALRVARGGQQVTNLSTALGGNSFGTAPSTFNAGGPFGASQTITSAFGGSGQATGGNTGPSHSAFTNSASSTGFGSTTGAFGAFGNGQTMGQPTSTGGNSLAGFSTLSNSNGIPQGSAFGVTSTFGRTPTNNNNNNNTVLGQNTLTGTGGLGFGSVVQGGHAFGTHASMASQPGTGSQFGSRATAGLEHTGFGKNSQGSNEQGSEILATSAFAVQGSAFAQRSGFGGVESKGSPFGPLGGNTAAQNGNTITGTQQAGTGGFGLDKSAAPSLIGSVPKTASTSATAGGNSGRSDSGPKSLNFWFDAVRALKEGGQVEGLVDYGLDPNVEATFRSARSEYENAFRSARFKSWPGPTTSAST
ncbi:uncharacterized protein SPPG_05901 [Spizellomyces punctatus DAOM BR117]|uniref:C3H1-type domain-containing protein n=1 Tax=Spizellomyces punctatus (strain DAOM BR117) TaxID=645134 RepID=A0A0L0HD88_SPIPD|nr:uncharacterized protein SPPG_05901 [Spizellomyces punctatus DAOM BR117]KNC98939.1 hypothetical protein SPPG_05901 [Spizellomyces punctatus DAOM BR117]|eukprot:XP_016606979.1 hypothetical protein SPPG_05901 [Spizellomyces punctatus DAOM BR117]